MSRSAVDRLLDDARARLDRVTVADLPREQEAGALVVDIRPTNSVAGTATCLVRW